jgi:hypothetical protein
LAAGALCLLAGSPATAGEKSALQIQFFESKVRPLLVQQCYECHGNGKHKGGLRLDSRAGVLAGGDSGPAAVPGKPQDSLLIQAVNYQGLHMPPKRKLSADQIAVLTSWVKFGLPYPGRDDMVAPPRHDKTVSAADRAWWAFRPVTRPAVPVAARHSQPAHPIDGFILAKLEERNLEPAAPAPVHELIRRTFFDLTGLPPTAEEMSRWTARLSVPPTTSHAAEQAAYAALIDDLLGRPAYGERWGRHWLDVVRFAQTNGYERDGEKPYAWRYRDYVIKSFNDDKPYDRFILEQLAGDELPDADSDSRIATGFYRLGVWDDEPDDARQAEFDELDDIMVTTGSTFLGLTLGCARCHEHKFDPIPQRDYYRLLAFFRNVARYANPKETLDSPTLLPLGAEATIRQAIEARDRRIRDAEARLSVLAGAKAKNSPERKQLEAEKTDRRLDGLDWALGVREHGAPASPTHVLTRGNAATPGEEVQPGFPLVLDAIPEQPVSETNPAQRAMGDLFPTSSRRLWLARWIANPANPLTARVIVNRVWHYHFGRGIVASTADFGKTGSLPTHPELLDWLADEFVRSGWSLKKLHKTIMLSQAYQRSSRGDGAAATADPGNALWWRQQAQRLDAEALRDALLAVSGELNRKPGGRGVFPRLSGEILAGQSKPGLDWEPSSAAEECRRSVYVFVKRGLRDPFAESFDYVNTTAPLTERPTTTVAPQALLLLNSRFVLERAEALASRLEQQAGQSVDVQIQELFQQALQRNATLKEREQAGAYLARVESAFRDLQGELTFRPDVPMSLYTRYRQQLAAENFLLGPRKGWAFQRGAWGGGYESIDVVDVRVGPFGLWQGATFTDGEIRGQLRFGKETELVTLMVRANAAGEAWSGIGITLVPRASRVELRQRNGNDEKTTSLPIQLPAGEWVNFRLQTNGPRLQVWLGTAKNAVFDRDDSRLPEAGKFGVAAWGGPVALRHVLIESAGQLHDVAKETLAGDGLTAGARLARHRALVSLCQAILNVNEFVYID